jgi:PAS domain S-box-containing protein
MFRGTIEAGMRTSSLRASAVAAAAILILGHLVLLLVRFDTEAASVWGVLIGAAAALLAAVASGLAPRNASPFGRRVWRLVSFSALLSFVGQLLFAYYHDYLHASAGTVWPSDILVFFWVVPAATVLFLSPQDPNSGFRWLRIYDFVQVCALVVALELSTLYVPSRWQAAEQAMANRTLIVELVFFVLLALGFVVRGLLTPFRSARGLFSRLAVFFFVFAANVAIPAQASGSYRPGRWPDLLWTATFCLLAIMAATWNDAEQHLERIGPASRSRQLLAQFSPLLIPAIVFPLLLHTAQERFLWAVVLAMLSFAAAGGRMLFVHNQLLVSSRELARNLALLQGITEGTTDAVFVKDLSGRYLMVNSSGARLLGRSVEEVIGKNDMELLSPEAGREIMERDSKVLQTGETRTYEEAVASSGLTRTYLSTKGPFRDASGEVVGLLGISRDMTEYKALEERPRHSERMEAVGRLAGGVAHDFNNLLTVIMAYSQILARGPATAAKVRDAATQIGLAAERAAGITRQLLAFSRKQVFSPRIIDLNTVLLSLEPMLRRLIREDIEVLTVRAPDLGTVKADPGQIEQVLMNLALNARDAMPHGGKLTLETANVQLDDAYVREHQPVEPGRYVMLAVSDTGVGMSPESQAHIFEPFYTTKEIGKGTGLGLSTVFGIVKQSGGYIWVNSEPGRGTTFKVYLPRMDQPAETRGSERSPTEVKPGTETVLLVEDDSQLRQLTAAILADCGYRVLVASSTDEALALCRANHCDIELLITDVVLPGMNGRQLAEQVTRVSPHAKVLYISGYASDAMVHRGALDAGLWFLPKPFSVSALCAKVREVLDAK